MVSLLFQAVHRASGNLMRRLRIDNKRDRIGGAADQEIIASGRKTAIIFWSIGGNSGFLQPAFRDCVTIGRCLQLKIRMKQAAQICSIFSIRQLASRTGHNLAKRKKAPVLTGAC